MSLVRATVTLPYITGLPEDVAQNTFHFATATSPPSTAELNAIEAQLIIFYNNSPGPATFALSQFISDRVSRTPAGVTIEMYNMADTEPRVPIRTAFFTLGASGSSTELPDEVALCLSFQADPISGVNQARRRGRVFIGPLNQVALASDGRPGADIIASGIDAMDFLDSGLVGSGVAWVVYSRVADTYAQVTNGWVDNAFDTQRRRGVAPTSRTTWT